jgi:hypothetical protein
MACEQQGSVVFVGFTSQKLRVEGGGAGKCWNINVTGTLLAVADYVHRAISLLISWKQRKFLGEG